MSEQEKVETEKSAGAPQNPADTIKLPDPPTGGGGVANRRSRWVSSLAALRYVASVDNDNELKVRDSDKATTITLIICCIGTMVCLIVPQLENHRTTFALASDVLVGIALLTYVANRFGIVTTFQPRQALITWQLMLGASLLGVFMTVNLALVIASFIQSNPIIIP